MDATSAGSLSYTNMQRLTSEQTHLALNICSSERGCLLDSGFVDTIHYQTELNSQIKHVQIMREYSSVVEHLSVDQQVPILPLQLLYVNRNLCTCDKALLHVRGNTVADNRKAFCSVERL